MEQNNLQKTQKSRFWIIANTWSYVFVYLFFFGIIWIIISWFLSKFLNGNIFNILEWLFLVIVLFYSFRFGIKTVLNKAIISKENIIKISIELTVALIIIQAIVTVIYGLFNFGQIGKLIFIDIVAFFSSYYWFKKFVV